MPKESDRQGIRLHVSVVLLGTIIIVYALSVLLIHTTKVL